MKKKKILFHINSLGRGGAERVVTVLSEYFSRDEYEVVIVTLWRAEKEYELVDKVRRLNLGDCSEKRPGGRISQAFLRFADLRRVISREAPDLVISFCNKANFRSAYSMWGMKTPLLTSVRNDPEIDYAPYRSSTRRMEKKAAGCVFQTPDAKAFFSPELQRKSRIIWNPVSEKYLLAGRERAEQIKRKEMQDGGYIVTVGRISKQKNQMLLLKAFVRIKDKYPALTVRIYGEDSDEGVREELKQYMEQQKIEDRVRFMGESNCLEKEIRDTSLFVLSSDYEGMPNALMEAMAMGLPVIATDCPCGGSGMLIEDGVSGRLVPVGDVGMMADAMEQLLDDRNLAEIMGENARQTARRAEPCRVYEEWKAYVEQLIK